MPDLRELYQETVLEHSKTPRNYRELRNANHKAEGFNPLCGDHFTIYVDLDEDAVRDVSFQGSGCAISKASASMMTQSVKGKTRAEIEKLFERFHDMVTGRVSADGGDQSDLGKLTVFGGVSAYPARVKCVTLAWHALRAALNGARETVSTE
jgi:nitrogen fixation protein NifU and related proteins